MSHYGGARRPRLVRAPYAFSGGAVPKASRPRRRHIVVDKRRRSGKNIVVRRCANCKTGLSSSFLRKRNWDAKGSAIGMEWGLEKRGALSESPP